MKELVYKYRKLLLSLGIVADILLVLCGLVIWQANKTWKSVEDFRFAEYVACVYFPWQHKLTGKWPTNLAGLSQYITTQNPSTLINGEGSIWTNAGEVDMVLHSYQERFVKFQIIQSDSTGCDFRLYLKERTIECSTDDDPSCHEVPTH